MADFVVEETDRLSRTVARYLEFARGSDAGRAAETGDAAVALEAMPQGGHLAVSLAERAGGELRIQSEVGRGTTSTVRFPKAETTRDARRENAR